MARSLVDELLLEVGPPIVAEPPPGRGLERPASDPFEAIGLCFQPGRAYDPIGGNDPEELAAAIAAVEEAFTPLEDGFGSAAEWGTYLDALDELAALEAQSWDDRADCVIRPFPPPFRPREVPPDCDRTTEGPTWPGGTAFAGQVVTTPDGVDVIGEIPATPKGPCLVGTRCLCGPPPIGDVRCALPAPACNLWFHGPWRECDQYFLALTWGMLQDNLDLVRWAMCKASGKDQKVTCLEELILDPSRVQLRSRGSGCEGLSARTTTQPRGRLWDVGAVIQICFEGTEDTTSTDGEPRCRYRNFSDMAASFFCRADTERDDDLDDQLCALVQMAVLILHELGHACGRAPAHGDVLGFDFTPGDCDVIDIVENYFASALMERYPRAAESDYCRPEDLAPIVGTGAEWSFYGLTRPGACR